MPNSCHPHGGSGVIFARPQEVEVKASGRRNTVVRANRRKAKLKAKRRRQRARATGTA